MVVERVGFVGRIAVGALLAAMIVTSGAAAQGKRDKAEKERTELRQRADKSLQKLFKEVKGSRDLYDKAVGYAVFNATKAGFFVSGGGGRGVAVDKSTNRTTYMKMGTGGVGLSFGAERFDMVFLFETKERLDNFIRGGWDSQAAAKATAGRDTAGVSSGFIDGQVLYTLGEKGLMASADVSGMKVWLDEELNAQ